MELAAMGVEEPSDGDTIILSAAQRVTAQVEKPDVKSLEHSLCKAVTHLTAVGRLGRRPAPSFAPGAGTPASPFSSQ